MSYPFGPYTYLDRVFLGLMEDVMRYGHQKHRENSFQAQVAQGSFERPGERWTTNAILHHIHAHALDYEQEVLHDHFNDLEHQLAAIAVNAMMECYFLLGEQRGKLDVQGESRSPEIEDC